jgi:uncharacterized membrane protein
MKLLPRKSRRRPAPPKFRRSCFEPLEERQMLSISTPGTLPPAIVVGRTLSAYSALDVQNNQVTITYTVYNEQADDMSGVLLTDTLEPGVTIQSASQLPDQSGQNLAWSLGTISGFDRASVTLTVSLASSAILQLDTGAAAFGTVDAGAVTDTTPAATLNPNALSAALLASTPDANTTDPYVQEEAAALDYNPQNIFNFLHDDVGYNSYTGSLRGARGTLWSSAGNSLDVASLGVALMRASGIPAQYEEGTLSDPLSKQLILSMFPASYQTVGYIPPGTQVSDPANDPQLLSETRTHFWFQFDAGAGLQDADPLMAGATIGQTFTASSNSFSVVPDAMRQKTEVQLNAEIYNSASALFGGSGLTTTTVLDQTFNDVDLVGHPLSIGNFVSTKSLGFILTSTTNTYTPYIVLGDDGLPDSQLPEAIIGQQYQEVLTNFPLGSQILTGLFLNVTLSGAGTTAETFNRTLVDRIGYAARQGLATPANLSINPSDPPIITPFDLTTLSILPGIQSPGAAQLLQERATQELASLSSGTFVTTAAQAVALIALARSELANFAVASDKETANLATGASIAAYFNAPRITMFSSRLVTKDSQSSLSFSFDLVNDSIRAIVSPGQNVQAPLAFGVARGMFDSVLEANALPITTGSQNLSAVAIIQQSVQQGIPLVAISASNLSQLQTLDLPADAIARITTNVENGLTVNVPARAISENGTPITAWFNYNPTTGEMIAENQNGGHQGVTEFTFQQALGISIAVHILIFGQIVKGYDSQPEPYKDPELTHVLRIVNDVMDFFPIKEFFDKLKKVLNLFEDLVRSDPPADGALYSIQNVSKGNQTTESLQVIAQSAGQIAGAAQASSLLASGSLTASWSSATTSSFLASSLGATVATVVNSQGTTFGAGTAVLSTQSLAAVSISGNTNYNVNGQGSLSFYGPAESSLGVSGDWTSYTATATGNLSITLTTDALNLNGTALPAGTYTITATLATLSGSGLTTSPNFSGSVSINATSGTVQLGPGTGGITSGGTSRDPARETTLDGYTGTINVAANGDGTDAVTLSGNSANVLQLVPNPATLTTDQNTPVTFNAGLQTSLADTYTLTANAPQGWTVTIDANGNVTATPAPGLQGGTYPIQIIAQSQTNPNLIAQSTVDVTITPTLPGMTLAVNPDPIFTVPFDGAQVPTAFQAVINNTGPTADSYNLSFSNIPAGFTLLNSGTSVTVPAGQTGIVGVYLQPNGMLPAPGTPLEITVTATSTSDPSITETVTEHFVMPTVDAVTLVSDPPTLTSSPGTGVSATVTLQNVGNVPETVSLASTLPAGLALSGLTSPITSAVGQSMTLPVVLTPDVGTPLNSTLQATITATFGPSGTPVTQTLDLLVQVVVPGAAAVGEAATAAGQLGDTDLANRLNDLSIAITNLVQTPDNAVYRSQTIFGIDAVVNQIAGDPVLSAAVGPISAARDTLAGAATPTDLLAALNTLAEAVQTLDNLVSDEAAHQFTLSLSPTSAVALPLSPTSFALLLQNNGTQATTYDLTASGLPNGVTGTFNEASVTLQPGAIDTSAILTITPPANNVLPFGFSVTATAEGASEITQTEQGLFTARAQIVQVVQVSPAPAFGNPGTQIDVTTRLLNAVNQQEQALVSYTVTDSTGATVFTSIPVSTQLSVVTSLTTVDLGNLDTTGFALGSYTIHVSVADASGQPIPGATGTGNLLIGTPVSATLSVSPQTLAPRNATVTNTLQVSSQITSPSPLSLVGQVSTDPSAEYVALYGNHAYVSGTQDISIVDVSNPASPQVVKTFGSSVLVNGGFNVARVAGNELIVATQTTSNSSVFNLLVYSLADPLNPLLLSNTQFNYAFLSDMFISGTTAYVTTNGYSFSGSFSSVTIGDQWGTFLAIDISNPAAPHLDGELFNNRGTPNGGNTNQEGGTSVNNQLAYVASTTSVGGNTQTGVGRVLVVNTANPASMSVATELDIPGTVRVEQISIQGNRALVVGSTGGYQNPFPPFSGTGIQGNLTLTVLDISDPQHPQIIGTTLVTSATFAQANQGTHISVVPVGANLFSVSDTLINGHPELLLVDTSDPNNIAVSNLQEPSLGIGMTLAGNLAYLASSSGLQIYSLGTVVPISVDVQIPNNTGVSIVPNSFNIAPSQIIIGTDFNTLVWNPTLAGGVTNLSFTWQTTVSSLQPGEARDTTLGATVDFVNLDTPGEITLPPTVVSGAQILSLDPASQTVQPGQAASYNVTLTNPTGQDVNYNLAAVGVPAGWVALPRSVTVPANGSETVALTLTTGATDTLGEHDFAITANTTSGVAAAVYGNLMLAGAPVAPAVDPESHGVVIGLTPISTTVGQGTGAKYVVQLTNTGSATDTFALALNLPPGISAQFDQQQIEVPPGASNFRDVTFVLVAAPGTTPGDYLFTLSATSTANPLVQDSTPGGVTVAATGVSVALSPGSVGPGGTFNMTVTNTGQITDTFDLSLGGPAAVVSTLASNSVTLAPGASQVVSISVGAIDFAVPGALSLTAIATSEANSAVTAGDTASVTIPTTSGLSVQFSPNTATLTTPGATSYLLLVNNLGNTEDSYTATISGMTGILSASLDGLDGQPTQTIPIFRLPGLSTGAILLNASMAAAGQGTITVTITDPSGLTESDTATLIVSNPTTHTAVASDHPAGSTYGQSVSFTATVSADAGNDTPTGSVQFQIDGTNVGSPVSLTSGMASFSTSALIATTHTITAIYTPADSSFNGSQGQTNEQVARAQLNVAADGKTKVYGASLPTLTGTLSDVVNGDGITASFTTTATAGSDVLAGGYAITPLLNDPDGRLPNYTVTATPGTLTITKANQSIHWNNPADIIYGTALGATQLNATASVVGPASAGAQSYTPHSGTVLNAGLGQVLMVTAAGTIDYNSATASVTINVGRAPLTVTADRKTKVFGAPVPALTFATSTFVNGDSQATALGGSLTTTATASSSVGGFPITQGTLAAANYTITFLGSTLTVTPAMPTVVASDAGGTANGNPFPATATAKGIGGATVSGNFAFTYYVGANTNSAGSSTPPTNVGTYTVVAAFTSTNANYSNAQSAPVTFTISPASGTISGTVYFDTTGNGLTSDDTPLTGVKVYLDRNNNGQLDANEPTVTTGSNGSYSFTGLASGNYTVREVVPTADVRTAPTLSDHYTVALAAGQTSSGNNFDNAQTYNTSLVSNVVYVLSDPAAVTDLRGGTAEGETVEVSFTVASGTSATPFSLVSYTAPGPTYVASQAAQQQVFNASSGVFGPGSYTLNVVIPHSYYQVDFVIGNVIDHLGPDGSNIFYSAQNRLISADNGGTHALLANPSRISGFAYLDANNNGKIDANERPVAGAAVTLTGTDSGGHSVTESALSDADGLYMFDNLPAGTYAVTETTPVGYTNGLATIGSVAGTVQTGKFSGIHLGAGVADSNNNFGFQQVTGSPVAHKQTGTIAFWNGTSGQALIKALNGGANAKNLSSYLASNFPNIYGVNAGSDNLTGKTNTQIAAFYQQLYSESGPKLDAETMALALAIYVTNSSLAGNVAVPYGFAVSTNGLATATFSVGANGAAFGVNDNAVLTVLDLLTLTNAHAHKGILWDLDGNGSLSAAETILRLQADALFDTINST